MLELRRRRDRRHPRSSRALADGGVAGPRRTAAEPWPRASSSRSSLSAVSIPSRTPARSQLRHRRSAGVLAEHPGPPGRRSRSGRSRSTCYALCILAGIIVAVCCITNHRLTKRGAEPWVVIDIALLAVAARHRRRAALPRRSPTPTTTSAPGKNLTSRSLDRDLGGRHRDLRRPPRRRRRRLHRLPLDRPPVPDLRRRRRARPAARAGHRPLRQLVQPRALRPARPTCRGASRSTVRQRGVPRRPRATARCSTRPSSTRCLEHRRRDHHVPHRELVKFVDPWSTAPAIASARRRRPVASAPAVRAPDPSRSGSGARLRPVPHLVRHRPHVVRVDPHRPERDFFGLRSTSGARSAAILLGIVIIVVQTPAPPGRRAEPVPRRAASGRTRRCR